MRVCHARVSSRCDPAETSDLERQQAMPTTLVGKNEHVPAVRGMWRLHILSCAW